MYVLSFLEPKDLLQAAQTCHYWRILAEDNLLWREKCREEGEARPAQMFSGKLIRGIEPLLFLFVEFRTPQNCLVYGGLLFSELQYSILELGIGLV